MGYFRFQETAMIEGFLGVRNFGLWEANLVARDCAPRSPRASRSPAKLNNITPVLHGSPVDSCVKFFQHYSSLENHL